MKTSQWVSRIGVRLEVGTKPLRVLSAFHYFVATVSVLRNSSAGLKMLIQP